MKSISEIAKRFNIQDVPKFTKEQIKERDERLERKLVSDYLKSKSKNFLKVRSIYNEQNVLNHTFKEVQPVSDDFVILAKKARKIADLYANGENFNTILAGQAGAGKTMLGVCILNWVNSNALKPKNCLFISVSELAELSFSQYRSEEKMQLARYNQALKDIGECDILMLDDLGTESSMRFNSAEASNTVQKALFRVGDLMQKKSVIITTNNSEKQLEDIYNQKIISRFFTNNPDHILNFNGIDDYRRTQN